MNKKIVTTPPLKKQNRIKKNKLPENKEPCSVLKHRPMLSAIPKNSLDQSRRSILNSFCCSQTSTKEKKNSVLAIHTQRKLFNQNNNKHIAHLGLTQRGNHSLRESLDFDSKIDLLESKINFLFGIIEDFEKQFLENEAENNIKAELKSLSYHQINKSEQELSKSKMLIIKPKKQHNKSVDFYSKTTMDNSSISQIQCSEQKVKPFQTKINYMKNKVVSRKVISPKKKNVGKKRNGLVSKKMVLTGKHKLKKNNSIELGNIKEYKQVPKLHFQKDKGNFKDAIEPYLENNRLSEIIVPEDIQDKCKSARLYKHPFCINKLEYK